MTERRRHGLTGGRTPHLLVLEPRMMFDAAMAATTEAVAADRAAQDGDGGHHDAAHAGDPGIHAADAHDAATPEHGRPDMSEAAAPERARDVIFIDTAVADYRQLADAWKDRGEVVLIDSARDGIDQMRAALAGRSDVAAIHIVSHGDAGVFFLGTTRVDGAAIAGGLHDSLAAIGRSLRADGDILIYGCDFAEGASGAEALHRFAEATGADVAASTDPTGIAPRGDWQLEAHDGAIEARSLDGSGWDHLLGPIDPVPISVTPDSLTVTREDGTVLVSPTTGATGYTADNGYQRTADVHQGAVARWSNAATLPDGRRVDLKATIVSLSSGDAVRFNRPTNGANGDDPTFLLRDVSANTSPNGDGASVDIRWELVVSGTDTPVSADVQFTIADIDGVGGNPNTRETVSTSTQGLSYYTRERNSDIRFTSTLDRITASGTQNENTDPSLPVTPASAASFDWTKVSQWKMTYSLAANNGVTVQAQFFNDGDADFRYGDPVYVSVPRLDLDGNDSTASGNDAHFTYTAGGAARSIADGDLVVTNPMPSEGIVEATIVLTNAKAGDALSVGTLPDGLSASTSSAGGRITVTISGTGSEADYAAAIRAIGFGNGGGDPDTTQRVVEVSFRNDTMTSATATSRIDINHAPTAKTIPATYATKDGDTITELGAHAFADRDGDTLTYTATGLPAGLTVDPSTGIVSGVVDRSASQVNGGRYEVVLTATDPSGASAQQRIVATVANPAPTANPDDVTTPEDTAIRIAPLANDRDPDGDPLRITGAVADHGSVARNDDGTLTYMPDADWNGTDTIRYTITDDQGGFSSSTVSVHVTPVNDAPVVAQSLPAQTGTDGAAVRIETAQGFADVDRDTLAYSATGLPAGLSIDGATGVITGTLDRSASQANGGAYDVTVTASDGRAATAQTFRLTVANPAPTANPDEVTTPEDTAIRIAPLANDTDPDGDPLRITGAVADHGSVARNDDGTLTYTPDADWNGTDTIRYTITDDQGGVSDSTVTVHVTPVNDAPRALAIPATYASQDGAVVRVPAAMAFSDPEGDRLTYAAAGLPAGLTIDPATGVISGTIDRAASQANSGRYPVTITATDPSGASAVQDVTLVVANPPPVAADHTASTPEETPVTVDVLATDRDPDGDALVVADPRAEHGTAVVNPDGTITYTPAHDFFGTDTVTYTLRDADGATTQGRITVTVNDVEDAPVAANDTLAAREDTPVTFDPRGNDRDPDGDPLTVVSAAADHGRVAIDPDGTLTYTPDADFNGADTIRYTISDGRRGTASAVVAVTVAPVEDAPIAADDAARTREDTAVTIDVLGNDRDPDGDPLTVVSVAADHGRVAINPDGTITYTPDADFHGDDTIRYTISDGRGGTASAIAAVTVDPVPDAPRPQPIATDYALHDGARVDGLAAGSFADPDGEPLTYAATGLPVGLSIDRATGAIAGTIDRLASQANDGRYAVTITATDPTGLSASRTLTLVVANTPPATAETRATTAEEQPVVLRPIVTDADGDPLRITGASAEHGRVAIGPDGTLTYTPDRDFNGIDPVRYTVADDKGGTATGVVQVTVTPVNDAPTAQPMPMAAARDGEPVSLDLAGFFADVDGDALRYAATGLPPGLSIDAATGRISGTLAADASRAGPYRVTVTATDPSGASASSGFAWTIVNPAPIAADDRATTDEDRSVTIPVLANDRDPDGDAIRPVAASALHGQVAINADGTLRYTPAPDFNGDDVITYTIADPDGGRATASVLVTVTPVADAPVPTGATLPPAAGALMEGQPVSLPAAPLFTDADGDRLAYAATGLPAGLAIDPATGAIAGTVAAGDRDVQDGVYRVAITATDPTGAAASTVVTLRVVNTPPVAADGTATVQEDGGVVIPAIGLARDANGDRLTVTAAAAQSGSVSINADGTLTYRPDPNFAGQDVIRYTIADGHGGTADAVVRVTVEPVNDDPVVPARDRPVDAVGGRPVAIDGLAGARDPDGDPLTIVGATAGIGRVSIGPGGRLVYAAPLGFVGTTTITYTVSDGRGGSATATILVRVAEGRAADVEQLLRIGRVSFPDPARAWVPVAADGVVRHPFALGLAVSTAVDGIRDLRGTAIGGRPVIDAVDAIRQLRGTDVDTVAPVAGEIRRLDRLADRRDAGDRLFDPRWGDFFVKGMTGFSAAADGRAGVMIESVVRDGAIYLEVRDTATDGRGAIRSVAVTPDRGERRPDWIHVDPRGLAIIERSAGMDELHLVVRVTREGGRHSTTRIVVQGATGEIELDRDPPRAARHAPLHATLQTPAETRAAAAQRLAASFE